MTRLIVASKRLLDLKHRLSAISAHRFSPEYIAEEMAATQAMPSATRQQQVDLPLQESRARMLNTFSDAEGNSYHDRWEKMWQAGDFLPWDRMVPSPALEDTLINHKDLIGTNEVRNADGTTRRKRALVPGCGRGPDVMLLQAFGYDVVGLEYSSKAVEQCEIYAKQTEDEELYTARPGVGGKGSRRYVQGNFFEDNWLEKIGISEKSNAFDLIYDYTFFCALKPSFRPQWAATHTKLLRKGTDASLICLEFPTTKKPSDGGPPFASPPKAYVEHLSHPGEDVPYDPESGVEERPNVKASEIALERVGHWHPTDDHRIGKNDKGEVTSYIGIWRHRA